MNGVQSVNKLAATFAARTTVIRSIHPFEKPAMPDKTTDIETPADLAAWAKALAAAVTPAELARLVKDYREQARNPRRSAVDREFAKRRGNALAKITNRHS